MCWRMLRQLAFRAVSLDIVDEEAKQGDKDYLAVVLL